MGIEVEDAVAHVWKGSSYAEQMKEMNNVTASGHYALLSACWYLDYISTAADWFDYYKCEPQVSSVFNSVLRMNEWRAETVTEYHIFLYVW